jgi:hypothetical protein
MKKNMMLLVSSLAILFSISATAEGNFIPVPTLEEAPLRVFAGFDVDGAFSPYQFNHMQGVGSVVYAVGSGFDVGFALHGGVSNHQGLFMANNKAYGLFGADFMLRFLGNVTEMFFMGMQATVGYDYNMAGANMTLASCIPVSAGLAIGLSFADSVQIYLFPQFNFGGKGSDLTVSTTNDAMWGKEIGMSSAVGAWINMGGTKLVIEARPAWKTIYDIGNFKSDNFSMNGLMGLAWDM